MSVSNTKNALLPFHSLSCTPGYFYSALPMVQLKEEESVACHFSAHGLNKPSLQPGQALTFMVLTVFMCNSLICENILASHRK